MSKFYITNNAAFLEGVKEKVLKDSPFKVSIESKANGIYALTTKKLQIDNVNGINMTDGFIIQTGTCIYKEDSGRTALTNAYNSYTGNVEEHREDYIGNYGCVINKNKTVVVFVDGAGFYSVYYYSDGKDWLVSTSELDMARVLCDSISVNKMNVLEELTRFAIFDNDTYFDGIKRLSGDQFLKITKDHGLQVLDLDLRIKTSDINDYDTRAKAISERMKYVAKVMYKNYGQTTLGCTGGFDSRMTLAAYLASGIKPNIAYGVGNSVLAPSLQGDVDVNRIYANRYGLNLNIASWNETDPIDKLWDEYIKMYGKLIYDGCEDAYKFYTNPEEKFLSFGYIAEIYREPNWSRSIQHDQMTLSDYLWKNHAECNSNIIERSQELTERWLNKWRKVYKKHGIISDKFNKEDLFWLCLEYRHSADNHMVNLVNQFKYANYLMSDLKILRNGYVDFKEKYDGRFMIKILNEVYPDILKVPFFTHCRRMIYNEALMQVEMPSEDVRKGKLKTVFRSIIPTPIKRVINKTFKRGVAGSEYLENVKHILEKDNNASKLRRLLGDDIFENLDMNVNHTMVLRGIILCKTFDNLGIKY